MVDFNHHGTFIRRYNGPDDPAPFASIVEALSFNLSSMTQSMGFPTGALLLRGDGWEVRVKRLGNMEVVYTRGAKRQYFEIKVIMDNGSYLKDPQDDDLPNEYTGFIYVKDDDDNIVFSIATSETLPALLPESLKEFYRNYLYKRDRNGKKMLNADKTDYKRVYNEKNGYWVFDTFIYDHANPTHPMIPPYVENGRLENAKKWDADEGKYKYVKTSGYYVTAFMSSTAKHEVGLTSLLRLLTEEEAIVGISPRWYSYEDSISDNSIGGHLGVDNIVRPKRLKMHLPYYRNYMNTTLTADSYPPIGCDSYSLEWYSELAGIDNLKMKDGTAFSMSAITDCSVKMSVKNSRFFGGALDGTEYLGALKPLNGVDSFPDYPEQPPYYWDSNLSVSPDPGNAGGSVECVDIHTLDYRCYTLGAGDVELEPNVSMDEEGDEVNTGATTFIFGTIGAQVFSVNVTGRFSQPGVGWVNISYIWAPEYLGNPMIFCGYDLDTKFNGDTIDDPDGSLRTPPKID